MTPDRKWRRMLLPFIPPIVLSALNRVRGGSRPPSAQQVSQEAAPRMYWGLHDLDRQIEKYLDLDGGYYVELGANNGLLASNTVYFERYRGWKGVLIEPVPSLYLECRKNRSLDNHVVCAACVPFGYDKEFVRIVYSDSMSVSLDLESDIADGRAHAELGRQFLASTQDIFEFGAVAKTLTDILQEAGAPAVIDFLSLDVEGAEVDVLKGVDHSRFRFRHMLIECRDIERLKAYLAPLSYVLVEKFNEHDYLFSDAGRTPQSA